jgi:ketosteroid isomerase-like protein
MSFLCKFHPSRLPSGLAVPNLIIPVEEQAMPSAAQIEIQELISQWAQAVRNQDFAGIRAHHAEDLLMFDVPPPFQSRGLTAYMDTWTTFYASQARPITFNFEQIEVTAGKEVAFASAIGTCRYLERGEAVDLKFRLTMGFERRQEQWIIVHEHHSVPAVD